MQIESASSTTQISKHLIHKIMSSAIENFKQLKSELESLKSLTAITIQQGQHAPNSPANNFVIPAMSGARPCGGD